MTETILRHMGLVRLDHSSSWEFFYWLTPEVTVFPLILAVYMVIRRSTKAPPTDNLDQMTSQQQEAAYKERNSKVILKIQTVKEEILELCCMNLLPGRSLVSSENSGRTSYWRLCAASRAWSRRSRARSTSWCSYWRPRGGRATGSFAGDSPSSAGS